MSGFGNDNNNENQDFGALNMGPDSMFSNIPENMPADSMSMFSNVEQNSPQENAPNPLGGMEKPLPHTPPNMQPNIKINAQTPNPQTPNMQPNIGAQAPRAGQTQEPQSVAQQKPQAPNVPHVSQPKAPAPHHAQPKTETKDELDDEVITVKPIRFASFENEVSAVGTPRKNLDIMQDVKAKITVELGRCKMKVKKVLDIQKGSIIEINKVAGEQVELFVCGKLVAHGEVIVIEDKFGLRITSIIEDKSL